MSPRALDVDAYLERVDRPPPARPSRRALAALQEAHLAAIPFENLDILLGRPISLELDALQAKLVDQARGGYCFEQNTLFRAVLEALGFRVTSLAARVRAGASVVRPRTHMLLLVEAGAERLLADVGFGGDGPLHPLPLRDGASIRVEGVRHRLRREEDLWVLEADVGAGWGDLYSFTLEPQHPVDFLMANHFTSTWPGSPFVNSLTAQRLWRGGKAVLRNRELVLRSGADEDRQEIRDPDHLLEVLERHFGLAFPAGTRFAQPAF